eukprot:GHVL01040416.1.p1 GENE.GHVL01040416.1~~GHVL01040416.1.p1  ORF type:complete len:804 (+),score=34.28 GHVL01040416.1:999-3410(+)
MKRSRLHAPPALHLGDGGGPCSGTSTLAGRRTQPMVSGCCEVGIPLALAGGQGPSYQVSSSLQAPLFSGGKGRPPVGGCLTDREGRGGSGLGPQLPGVLWTAFRGPQSFGSLASCLGSFVSQQVFENDSIQDGDSCLGSGRSPPRRLGDLHRLDGCVLPYSGASRRPEMAPFPVGQSGLPVPRTPLGLSLAPWIFTMVVRQLCALVRSQGVRLRAYLDDWLIMGQSEVLCSQHTQLVLREASLLGFSGQPCEVRARTVPVIHLPGDDVQHGLLDCPTLAEEGGQAPGSHTLYFASPAGFTPDSGLHPGADRVHGSSGSTGESSQAPASACTEAVCGLSLCGLEHSGSPWGLVPGCNPPVAGLGMGMQGGSHCSPPSRHGPLHRCVPAGLGGSSHGPAHGLRSVVCGTEHMAHQLTGVGGRVPCSGRVPPFPSGQARASVHRQYDSGGLREQAGRFAVPHSLTQNVRDPDLVLPARDLSLSTLPAGKPQHTCGCAQPLRQGVAGGMDHHARGPTPSLGGDSEASGGSLRHQILQAPSGVCLSLPRPGSVEDQRLRHLLGRAGGLRLSSLPASRSSNQEGGFREAVSASGHPSVAVSALVSRPSETHTRPSNSSFSGKRRPRSASNRSSSRGPAVSESSRVETVRSALKRSGASDRTLELVQRSHRASTASVYSSHWRSWVTWCQSHGLDPVAPRTMHVANHLADLSSQGASSSSLKVRRSAIASTLKQIGHTINVSGVVAGVIKGASFEDVKRSSLPKWDLSLVLEFLRSADFEPLGDSSLSSLTNVAVFLLCRLRVCSPGGKP